MKIQDNSFRELISEIINQAVSDYRLLHRRGLVKNLQHTTTPTDEQIEGMNKHKLAKDTCNFWNSPDVDKLLEIIDVDFRSDSIVRRLLELDSQTIE